MTTRVVPTITFVLFVLVATAAHAGTSEELRQGKILGVSTGMSFTVPMGVGFDLKVQAYLEKDMLIEADFYWCAALIPLIIESRVTAVSFKYFVSNAIYLKGGFGYRGLMVDEYLIEGVMNAMFDGESDQVTESSDLGIQLVFGSQWQWEYFTLGVEWISFYYPLVILDAEQIAYHNETGEELQREPIDSMDRVMTLKVFTFTLGATF